MTKGFRLTTTQRIAAAAMAAAILGGVPAPSNAAELLAPGPRVRHVRVADTSWGWRERCAYAGHYCLYAEYGYVYHYPFDDRPIAYTRRRLARR